ncbi:hypothetical protein EJB05_06168, partial [Eragrostis curvula]
MEARRFGFGGELPAAFKFDPTDADIVTHYLLPRALGLPNQLEHAVIDDDPAGCPPWELLRRHGHGDSDHAFFFAPPRDPTKNVRTGRVVPPGEDGGVGGKWQGQKAQEGYLVLVRGGDGGGDQIELRYKRYNLSYCCDGEDKTSGWVMHEYQIIDPPLLPVLARVKIADAAKKDRRQQQQEAAAQQCEDQPGPSGSYYLVGDHAPGNGAMARDGEGTSSSRAQVVVEQADGGGGFVMGEPAGTFTELLNAGEGDCYYADNSISYFNQGASTGNNSYGCGIDNYHFYSGSQVC